MEQSDCFDKKDDRSSIEKRKLDTVQQCVVLERNPVIALMTLPALFSRSLSVQIGNLVWGKWHIKMT